MVGGGGIVDNLRPVAHEELLGRDRVELDMPRIAKGYAGRSALVSGAGGSIGSDLCRQLVAAGVSRLVMLERSELALYEIERDLSPLAAEAGTTLVSRLGDVCDRDGCARLMREHGIEIVLHAAAYKHVPLMEANEAAGTRNNVLGTRALALAAREAGVARFILVSTDKAVRPTNVMGATKRLAEMVVQDQQRRASGTVFSMVRFGNVLGSSGSVIPLFRRQIADGGPVTLTHRDVTRYFMTIPEAARLVLLAGSYAEGGEVFVLDMGEPVAHRRPCPAHDRIVRSNRARRRQPRRRDRDRDAGPPPGRKALRGTSGGRRHASHASSEDPPRPGSRPAARGPEGPLWPESKPPSVIATESPLRAELRATVAGYATDGVLYGEPEKEADGTARETRTARERSPA